jgi:hypothetical protein
MRFNRLVCHPRFILGSQVFHKQDFTIPLQLCMLAGDRFMFNNQIIRVCPANGYYLAA